MTKPTLGYPSRTDAVIALLQQGKKRREIAALIGITEGCVAALIASSRRKKPAGAVAARNGTSIEIRMTLEGPLAETLLRHADRRKCLPVDVMADIVDAVLGDDIVDAVLDDGDAR